MPPFKLPSSTSDTHNLGIASHVPQTLQTHLSQPPNDTARNSNTIPNSERQPTMSSRPTMPLRATSSSNTTSTTRTTTQSRSASTSTATTPSTNPTSPSSPSAKEPTSFPFFNSRSRSPRPPPEITTSHSTSTHEHRKSTSPTPSPNPFFQKKPRHNSGSAYGSLHGRHGNEWLFGGVSITETVKHHVTSMRKESR